MESVAVASLNPAALAALVFGITLIAAGIVIAVVIHRNHRP